MSNVRKLFTQCVLLSTTEIEEVEGKVAKEDYNVCCNRLRMPFDSVCDRVPVEDFKTIAYDLSLSSLTKKALQGESAICILCGDHNETNWTELLRACVTELLEVAGESERKVGVIKLCWFTVGADGAETLVDVLKAPPTTPVFSSAHKCIELVMRELSGGRGVIVPGIVEMELNTIADLQKVFDHAHSFSPGIFTDTSVHSIVQLSFADKRKVEAVRMRQKDFVAQGALRDPPGLGRITFLQLSNLRSQGPKSVPTTPMGMSPQRMQYPLPPTRTTLLTKIEPPTEPVRIDFVTEAGGFYPWIEHSRQVLLWMENKRVSTPFHRSRLLLLLKDVLLRRQPATMLLCLQPSAAQTSHHEDWLRVVWLLSRDFAPLPIAITPSASPAVRKHHPYSRHESEYTTTTSSAHDHINGENVETASVTWVFPGEDDSTVNSHSAYSSSPEHASPPGILKGPSKGSSPGYTDSIHWRAAMRARAMDYARTHSPRRRGSRSSSRSHSRRPSRTDSPRSPSETSISPHTPNLTNPTSRSRVNSVDSRANSVDHSIEAGWDRTTTPGRSSSRHRVRLQLQTEFSPHSHQVDNDSPEFAYAAHDHGAGQEKPTVSPPPSTLSSAVSSGTPSAMVHQRRFFRSTLERIEGQIFEGAHGTGPVPSPKRTKPASPKPRVKHLTSKEMSAAMRVLANRNKKLVATAAKDKDDLLGAHNDSNTKNESDHSSSTVTSAEVEDLKKRLAEAQGRCTTLETEQGVPLTYPTYDPNLFYTKWGPISPSKRRASVQTFLQARGAAIDHSTDTTMLPVTVTAAAGNNSSSNRLQDIVYQAVLNEAQLATRTESNDSRDGEESQPIRGRTTMNRVFGEMTEEKGSELDSVEEETETQTEESCHLENEGKSVEEQLRETLESLRVLGIKYEELERKYNALLAARSAQQMQDNPMSASRPLSIRQSQVSPAPAPSPAVTAAVPPTTRSSLTALFPSNENAPDKQQSFQSKSVTSVSASVPATPVAKDRNYYGGNAKVEQQSVSQGLMAESFTAVRVHVSEETKTNFSGSVNFPSKELNAESPVVFGNTTVQVVSAASDEIGPKATPDAVSSPIVAAERRSSALARTSIRTSPIPSDSIPSVSPIRFQRTRCAPREPVATPFESSFQATDYSNEHDQVIGAGAAWVSAEDAPTVKAAMEKGAEERSALDVISPLPLLSSVVEKVACDEVAEAPSVKVETPEVPPVVPHASAPAGLQEKEFSPPHRAVHADATSELSMAKNASISQTTPYSENVMSSEPTVKQSEHEKIDAIHSEALLLSDVDVSSQKSLDLVKSGDSTLECAVEQRPTSTRLPFKPTNIEPRPDKGNILSSLELFDTPTDEPQDTVNFEKDFTLEPEKVHETPPPVPVADPVVSYGMKGLPDYSFDAFTSAVQPVTEMPAEKTVSFAMPPSLPPPPPLSAAGSVASPVAGPPAAVAVALSPPLVVSKTSSHQAAPALSPPVPMAAEAKAGDAHLTSRITSNGNAETKDELLEEDSVPREGEPVTSVLPSFPTNPSVAPLSPPMEAPAVNAVHITEESSDQDELIVSAPARPDPSASPEFAKPHLRMSISKTRVPQFLLYRHSDSAGSGSDDEGEQETPFPAAFGATWEKDPAVDMGNEDAGESSADDEAAEENNNDEEQTPVQTEPIIADVVERAPATDGAIVVEEMYPNEVIYESPVVAVHAQSLREEAVPLVEEVTAPSLLRSSPVDVPAFASAPSTPVDVVTVAATTSDSMTSAQPSDASESLLQTPQKYSGSDTSATVESWETAPETSTSRLTATATERVASTVHTPEKALEQKEDVIVSPFPPSPELVVQQTEETSSHRPSVAVPSPLATAVASQLTFVNEEMVDTAMKPAVHHEGMYAQLAHATSPVRHDTIAISSPVTPERESVHTGADTCPVGPSSVLPSSTVGEPVPHRTGTNSYEETLTLKGERQSHTIQTISEIEAVEEEVEEIDEDDVETFDASTLPDTFTTHRNLSDPQPFTASALPSLPELPVPAGMYGQLAHSAMPVRPVSVPTSVSSGIDAATAKTKTLKSTRWSWLRKKST